MPKQIIFQYVLDGIKYNEGWFDKKDYKELQNIVLDIQEYNNRIKEEFSKQYPKAIDRLMYLSIKTPTINLKEGEICFYEGPASSYHTKNVVVAKKTSGASASFRVAKGVSIRTGGGDSRNIREDVIETFAGKLYLTSMRVVLLTEKYGFDVARTKITKFEKTGNGFNIFVGAKSYVVGTDDVEKIIYIMNLINEGIEEQNNKNDNEETDDYYEEIKKLKELLDLGILTTEEFNKKKKQLLGL